MVINKETCSLSTCREKQWLRKLRPKWDIYITLLSRVRDACGRQKRKNVRTRSGRWRQGNCFPYTTGHMHTRTHRNYGRPVLAHARGKFQYGWEVTVPTIPPSDKKLFATDSFWERGTQFSSVECHWAYESQHDTDLMVRVSQTT